MQPPSLEFLAAHLYVIAFAAFLIEAAGTPFPSRIILILAATVAQHVNQLAGLVAASALGAVIGDHVPYTAGRLVGPRLLALYCRLTLASERCVEKTVAYFVRFGAAAILMSRFSASVRILASVLSGCGHIGYRRFLGWDLLGSVMYATAWGTVGYLLGDQALALLRRFGGIRALVAIGPVAFIAVIGYRLWRRSRYGFPRAGKLTEVACERLSDDGAPLQADPERADWATPPYEATSDIPRPRLRRSGFV